MEGKKICTRGPNFSEDERAILLQLITDRKNTIENKATNKVSNICKQKAWEEVTDIFNASVSIPRTVKQLKIVYENMKRRMKIYVDEQNYLKKTGYTY
ncbi:unnamed protein product [Phyllotreta striolata]|uniref:Regulatory protein zeste n=1 Tax=Phyllotreta striolata TaxID=444603 RepID=A0A9N9TQB9_PHYSR|nr:unnamed protein product [Phyllotreta striolata]